MVWRRRGEEGREWGGGGSVRSGRGVLVLGV